MSSNGHLAGSEDYIPANGTSDHSELLEQEDRQLLILYASQTGSAQDVAEYIGREAWRRYFRARVIDIQDFDRVCFLSVLLLLSPSLMSSDC
jgi:sulfite reductase alpha subunit-like flavoprotein